MCVNIEYKYINIYTCRNQEEVKDSELCFNHLSRSTGNTDSIYIYIYEFVGLSASLHAYFINSIFGIFNHIYK